MSKLQIIPTNTRLELSAGRADAAFTATNAGPVHEYSFSLITDDPKCAAWVQLKGPSTRTLVTGAVETLVVSIDTSAAQVDADESHTFFLRAVSTRDPDENWVDSQAVAYVVRAKKRVFPWKPFAIGAAVLAAIIIGVVTWQLLPGDPGKLNEACASRAKSPCVAGLQCLNEVCSLPILGTSCIDQCAENLVCRESVCKHRFTTVESTWRTPSFCDNYEPGGDTPASLRRLVCGFSKLDLAKLTAPLSMPIYTNQPRVQLESSKTFGRYNPEFVRWLVEHGVPGEHDSTLRQATQSLFDQSFRSAARLLYMTKRAYDGNSERAQFTRTYELLMTGELGFTAFQYFQAMDPHRQQPLVPRALPEQFDAHYRIASMFWVRRAIDGTGDQFFVALKKLLKTYDNSWLEQAERVLPAEFPDRATAWLTPN